MANPPLLGRGLYGPALPLVLILVHWVRRRPSRSSRGGRHSPASPNRASASGYPAAIGPGGNGLRGARMDGADLSERDLRSIDARGAQLRRSDLSRSRLSGARLDGADLSKADLRHTDLRGASLTDTDLWRSDLRGADLRGCRGILRTNLRSARFDHSTRWPAGFDPEAAGATSGPR